MINQLLAIAIGGATGAILRFWVGTGVYQWLGREFPYGTLVVNVIGSFLIGLLAETLILQRVTQALDYRAAILVGFIGAFTTFSTFSLETFYLLEQGQLHKAALNVVGSVCGCLLAVWIGLLTGRVLFGDHQGMLHLPDHAMPYGMMVINSIGAFIIGMMAALLQQKMPLPLEQGVTGLILIIGLYLTLSGLYLVLLLIEHGVTFEGQTNFILGLFIANSLICSGVIWLGLVLGRQV
jgi:CrcB protein